MKRGAKLTATGGALAVNPSLRGGGGGAANILTTEREVVWSEPPDINGLIGSSEIIGQFGLTTEIANDFFVTSPTIWGSARWWGGYYNEAIGCGDHGVATTWNLRIYEDGGCVPANVFCEYPCAPATETSVGCQSGSYPLFEYYAQDVLCCQLEANTLYWFGAQACDHVYQPQVGRLASGGVVNCDTVFKSAYFSYPDWTPAIDVFGVAFDASQEFENTGCITPTEKTTWGSIKGLFR